MSTFGERMRQARESKHLRQDDVADYLGVSISTISKWENDKSAPLQKKLLQVSNLYGVDSNYLLTGEQSKEDELESRIARIFKNLDEESKRVVLEMVTQLEKRANPPEVQNPVDRQVDYVLNKYAIRNDDELMTKSEVAAYIKVKEILSKEKTPDDESSGD